MKRIGDIFPIEYDGRTGTTPLMFAKITALNEDGTVSFKLLSSDEVDSLNVSAAQRGGEPASCPKKETTDTQRTGTPTRHKLTPRPKTSVEAPPSVVISKETPIHTWTAVKLVLFLIATVIGAATGWMCSSVIAQYLLGATK